MIYDFGLATISKHNGIRLPNQDAIYCNPENGLCIVADGMGGHDHGELASARAVKVIRDTCSSSRPNRARLYRAFDLANKAILSDGVSDSLPRGCVVTVAWFDVLDPYKGFILMHAGDTEAHKITRPEGRWEDKLITRCDNDKDGSVTLCLGLQAFMAEYTDKSFGKLLPDEILTLESDGLRQVIDYFAPGRVVSALTNSNNSSQERVDDLLGYFSRRPNIDDASIVLIRRTE